jgi:RHS repeat-associated protein
VGGNAGGASNPGSSGSANNTVCSFTSNGTFSVATTTATGATPIIRYIHPDHLGSTNVVTDANQNVTQTLDYFPYGGLRVSVSTSTNEKRKFIGQFSDDSGLSYFNARYMDPSRGQFTTEEPIFLKIGDSTQVKQLSQQDQQTYLTDPQQLNSYSYGRDNPITKKDPNGRQAVAAGALVLPELAPVLVPAAIITTAGRPEAVGAASHLETSVRPTAWLG